MRPSSALVALGLAPAAPLARCHARVLGIAVTGSSAPVPGRARVDVSLLYDDGCDAPWAVDLARVGGAWWVQDLRPRR